MLQLPTLLGHLWVLLVAAAAAWRHTDSRTYLSGLDWQLSVLLSASLLALLLLALTRRLTRPAGIAGEAAYPLRSQHRGLAWLHAVLSLLVVFALWYLETRPLTPPID